MAFVDLSEKLRDAARVASVCALYAKSNTLNDKANDLEEAAKDAILKRFSKETLLVLNGAWSSAYEMVKAEMQEVSSGGV